MPGTAELTTLDNLKVQECSKPKKELMLCSWEKDPRQCLEEGKLLNQCAQPNKVESFTEYWTCSDYSDLQQFLHCHKEPAKELSKVTKVKTDRTLPYHSRPRPEPNPEIESNLKPAKHGSHLFFLDHVKMSSWSKSSHTPGNRQ
ncbi:hypothetical protein AB1E19_018759 [Capra hircus]